MNDEKKGRELAVIDSKSEKVVTHIVGLCPAATGPDCRLPEVAVWHGGRELAPRLERGHDSLRRACLSRLEQSAHEAPHGGGLGVFLVPSLRRRRG